MTSYQDDPLWQAARDDYSRDTAADETPSGAFLRRVTAALDMAKVEIANEEPPR